MVISKHSIRDSQVGQKGNGGGKTRLTPVCHVNRPHEVPAAGKRPWVLKHRIRKSKHEPLCVDFTRATPGRDWDRIFRAIKNLDRIHGTFKNEETPDIIQLALRSQWEITCPVQLDRGIIDACWFNTPWDVERAGTIGSSLAIHVDFWIHRVPYRHFAERGLIKGVGSRMLGSCLYLSNCPSDSRSVSGHDLYELESVEWEFMLFIS